MTGLSGFLSTTSIAMIATLAAVPSAAQETAETEAVDASEIVVTGVRRSISASVESKREATTVLDSISAEELGKFPDRNVADSLGNVPGISVRRTRGAEGQNVSIRGLGQGFAVVTLNDRILPTDNSSREFSFDVLPSEMISGADVYKGTEASLRDGSIGGIINLRSARPFDFDAFTAFGSIEGEYNDLSEEFGGKTTGVVSGTFADKTIGALLSVSYSDRKIRTDNLREYFITSETEVQNGVDFNGNGSIDDDGESYVYPQFYSPGAVLGDRKRLGVSAALQFAPTDALEITLDGLYSHYKTPTRNYAQSNFIEASRFAPGSITVDDNNVVTGFTINDLVAEVLTYEEPRTVETYLAGANVKFEADDLVTFFADAYIGEATRDSAGDERFFVAGILDSIGTFTGRDNDFPDFDVTIPGGRPLSAATNDDYRAHYLGIFGSDVSDKVYGIKTSGLFEFPDATGFFRSLDVGFSVNYRRKDFRQFGNPTTECSFCGYPFTFSAIGADFLLPLPVDNLLAGRRANFPREFAIFDNDAYLAALKAAENNPAVINPETGLPYPAGYADQVVQPLPVESFDISETIMAGWLQINFASGPLSGNLGGRLVSTRTVSRGAVDQIISITKQPNQTANFDVVRSPATPVEGRGEYLRFLPAINIAYDFTDDLRLRLAAAKTIARPSIDQLSPASSDNSETGDFTKFNFGNPNLRPVEANQADLSLEWYFAPSSVVAAALFYKDIKNFITTGIDQEVIAGQTFTVITVTNGDSGKVMGLELTLNWLFDNGFGVAANVTGTKSEARLGDIVGDLEDVTPLSVNLSALYERGPIGARITYSYDRERTVQLDGFVEGLSVQEDDYHDLSVSANYDLTPNLELFVEGSNLLNSKIERYNTFRNVPAFYEENGRSFFAGVRARL